MVYKSLCEHTSYIFSFARPYSVQHVIKRTRFPELHDLPKMMVPCSRLLTSLGGIFNFLLSDHIKYMTGRKRLEGKWIIGQSWAVLTWLGHWRMNNLHLKESKGKCYLKIHMWGKRLFRAVKVLDCTSLTLEQVFKENVLI